MKRYVTSRLVTATTAAVAGVLLAVVAGQPEAALLVAPWIVLLVLGLNRQSTGPVEVDLSLDHDRVVAGNPVELNVDVRGVDGWVDVTWMPPADFSDGGDDANHHEVAKAAIAAANADGTANLTCRLAATGWGVHDVGQVKVNAHHCYGLTVSSGVVGSRMAVQVHPSPIDLRRLLAPWFVRRLTGAHRSKDRGQGIEFADIRPYGPGDSQRDINWRASARSQQLLISQRQPDRATDVILLVDSFVESGHDATAVLAQTIEAAVALAESHLSVSDRVGLIELGGVLRWFAPASGRIHLQRLIDGLLATTLYRSDVNRDLSVISPRILPPRSFVVALTPLLDNRFIDALTTLRGGGHDVAVVAFPVPVDDKPSRPGGGQSTATRLWNAERAMVHDRLGDHGIAVVTRAATDHDDGLRQEPWDELLQRLTVSRRRLGSSEMSRFSRRAQ